ncbi:MAG TPA: helix-turn-helix domain-containing protein, partial [Longimicrobiales bacterium]|nr:helix-turn-helix domain-containing protein [Longimicrobiales bacterium]
NVLERARIVAGDVERLEPEHLPPELRAGPHTDRADGPLPSLEDLERRHIERALLHYDGNRTHAAEALGISRATLHNKIKKYGLETVGLETA